MFHLPGREGADRTGWDLSHPTAAQDIAKQDADIIFAPSYWLGIDSEPSVFPLLHVTEETLT